MKSDFNNNSIQKISILFTLVFFNLLFCYSQDNNLMLDESYKKMHHILESFKIDKVDDKEIFIWKNTNEKVDGLVEFQCNNERMNIAENSGIEGKIIFKNGLKNGESVFRNCQTTINYTLNYKNGIIDGICRIYLKMGKIRNEKIVTTDTIFYETTFVNGNGIWKDFYGNGHLKEIGEYKQGKKMANGSII